MSTIAERVERGAALLDESRPGWWWLIDLDRLDVASSCDCIAGQQPGGYGATMNALGIGHTEEARDCGFDLLYADPDLPVAEFGRLVADDAGALTGAWRDLITSRRIAAEAP